MTPEKKLQLFGVYAGCKSEIVFLRHHREAFLIKPVWQCCDRSVTPDFFLAKIDAAEHLMGYGKIIRFHHFGKARWPEIAVPKAVKNAGKDGAKTHFS